MSRNKQKGHGLRSTKQKDYRERRDSRSPSQRKAWEAAQTANKIVRHSPPLSRNKVEDKNTGKKLDQWQFENHDGEKIPIRTDPKTTYPDGGTQNSHFNAEPSEKLKQDH